MTTMDPPQGFDAFLEAAWADHGEHPDEVAQRLWGSLSLVGSAAQVAPYARLVAHVYGEHLGRFDQGIALLESMRSLACFDAGVADAALRRNVAVLRFAGGDAASVASLPVDERITALAVASSTLAGRLEHKRAIDAYGEAIALAHDHGLAADSPAVRALAIGGNNLACALEEKADRDADETLAMVSAAEGGLEYWRLAGTWLEEERALYRLSSSLMLAGRQDEAIRNARRCIEICADKAAAPIERFFAHAALALAQRASGDTAGFREARDEALVLHALIPADERSLCEADLRRLGDT